MDNILNNKICIINFSNNVNKFVTKQKKTKKKNFFIKPYTPVINNKKLELLPINTKNLIKRNYPNRNKPLIKYMQDLKNNLINYMDGSNKPYNYSQFLKNNYNLISFNFGNKNDPIIYQQDSSEILNNLLNTITSYFDTYINKKINTSDTYIDDILEKIILDKNIELSPMAYLFGYIEDSSYTYTKNKIINKNYKYEIITSIFNFNVVDSKKIEENVNYINYINIKDIKEYFMKNQYETYLEQEESNIAAGINNKILNNYLPIPFGKYFICTLNNTYYSPKINRKVNIFINHVCDNYDENYDFFGAVIHDGNSGNSGHYYSIIKKKNLFFVYDDLIIECLGNNIDYVNKYLSNKTIKYLIYKYNKTSLLLNLKDGKKTDLWHDPTIKCFNKLHNTNLNLIKEVINNNIRGVYNPGAICYFNSLMSILVNMPEFVYLILNHDIFPICHN